MKRIQSHRAIFFCHKFASLIAIAGMLHANTAVAACETYPVFKPLATAPSNTVWEADRLVDSIGTNLHIGQGYYVSDFNTRVKPRLSELKVRYTRTNAQGVLSHPDHIRQLGELGIRFTVTTNENTDLNKLIATIKNIGTQHFFSIEGLNEPENKFGCDSSGTCWVSPTRNHQVELYQTVRRDSALAKILVLGPSLKGVTTQTAPKQLGNLSNYLNGANMHRYPGAHNYPERPTILGYLDNYMNYVTDPTTPAFLTETGYSNSANNTTEAEDAMFMPRVFLYNFDHGLKLTSKYEFLNEGNSTEFQENFGYIRMNNTVKPSFTAIKNLIALLSDPGSRFAPTALSYSLTGNTTNVYKVLMQKRDGTYYLALWAAESGPSPAARSVTINLPTSVTAASSVKPNTSNTWSPIAVSGGKINVSVNGYVTIVKFKTSSGAPKLCAK